MISPDGRDGSAVIRQDAIVHRLQLGAGDTLAHEVQPSRGVWLQLITGELRCGGKTLRAGDGVSTEDTGSLAILASQPSEALLFDLGPFAGRRGGVRASPAAAPPPPDSRPAFG